MERDLRELILTVQEPHLRVLLERVLGERSEMWAGYRMAPAAKYYHQAYPHGLLEHCLGVAQAVSATSATFPGIDRDVAVTGALLHDIGKLEAYTDDPRSIDLTDLGRLHGEIALGYYRIRREIEEIEGFPEQLAWAVLHIILSHHGSLEHGSPVVPCTREATLVHHDRQPRWAAGQLRPPREGARPRPPLVGARPRARRRRVLPPSAGARVRRLEAA